MQSQMVDKMSQTQLVHILFIYKVQLKSYYMFRPFTLSHHQIASLNHGNHKMYDVKIDICVTVL